MKDIRKLAVILLVVCIFCCSCGLTCSKETMYNWIEHNAHNWDKIVEDFPFEKSDSIVSIDPAPLSEMRGLLHPISIVFSPQSDLFSISFEGSYCGETSKTLLFTQMQTNVVEIGSIHLSINDIPPARITENSCRWEGIGADGTGYMYIELVTPGWFYLETYYPT